MINSPTKTLNIYKYVCVITICSLLLSLVIYCMHNTISMNYISGRKLDVSVQGRGFILVKSADDSHYLFIRSGRFQIENDSRIALRYNRTIYYLQPDMHVSSDYTKLNVTDDGFVECVDSDGCNVTIGEICIYLVPGRDDPENASNFSSVIQGDPAMFKAMPGTYGTGVIKTGQFYLSLGQLFTN